MSGSASKKIYLAGGCFWGVEELFRQIPGVVSTRVGYANGTSKLDANYERVCKGDTGFRETVCVEFDPRQILVEQLLWAYFCIIDPTIVNQQGNDRGTQYQTGIYWNPEDTELESTIKNYLASEREKLKVHGKQFAVESGVLRNFYDAEEYHQKYLVKNPGGYCHVSPVEMGEVLSKLTNTTSVRQG